MEIQTFVTDLQKKFASGEFSRCIWKWLAAYSARRSQTGSTAAVAFTPDHCA
jgi:hypothetical protein